MASEGSLPVDQAAQQLGIPSDALRLHLAAHELADPAAVVVSRDRVEELQNELRTRSGALRLDDLAKTALTIEWLAEHAVKTAHQTLGTAKNVEALEAKLGDGSATKDVDKKLAGLRQDLDKISNQDSGSKAIQQLGSLQTMIESQGREIDRLRADLAEAQRQIQLATEAAETARSETSRLLDALRTALGVGSPAGEPSPKASKARKEAPAAPSEPAAPAPRPSEAPKAEPKFQNTAVATPVKFGLKREIEYNFLLERMEYRRPDSYTTEELSGDAVVQVPDDSEIREFLAKYELGGDPEQVEILMVHRGEYQMIQYQRVEKPGGLRGWIPAKRK